jgi:light-regulated signal transduction histidine kinase (bacteriophytochrome)
LLTFSRLNRQPVRRSAILPASLAQQALDELAQAGESGAAAVTIEALLPCTADPVLLRQVFTNLLSNALKFTARQPVPRITLGCHATSSPASPVYFVQDNGVGFDMRYADKLFGVFHRLHRMEDYPGTGVGLALVQRIIHRHGGRIWAEAALNEGATFFFTVGENNDAARIN